MLATALSVGVGAIVIYWGAVAHELTHAAAARLLGGRVLDIDLARLHVDAEMPDARSRDLMLIAPAIVGAAISPAVVAVLLSDMSLLAKGAIGFSWLIYTANGGTEGELSLRRTPLSKV